jgi:hypothetical protein
MVSDFEFGQGSFKIQVLLSDENVLVMAEDDGIFADSILVELSVLSPLILDHPVSVRTRAELFVWTCELEMRAATYQTSSLSVIIQELSDIPKDPCFATVVMIIASQYIYEVLERIV